MSSFSTDSREIRRFGAIALVFFGTLFGIGLWLHRVTALYLFGILSSLGLGFIIMPAQMRPLYASWLKVAHFIGRITTAVILTLTFYLVIAPTALFKRLLGGRPLPTSPDKTTTSYWVTRPEPAQPRERFAKRY